MIHYMTTNGLGNATVGKELFFVGKAGVPFSLHSMRRPGEIFFTSEWAENLDRETRVLYPLPAAKTAWAFLSAPFRHGPRFFGALWNALFGRRESLRARAAGLAHLVAACYFTWTVRGEEVTLIHSQWIHSGGTIAMYAGWLLGRPFSFTGHATDLFRDRAGLENKVRRADFIVCISEFHRRFYRRHGAAPEKLHVIYCAIDVDLFSPAKAAREDASFHVLGAGRLVEKKGFRHLIESCRRMVEDGRDVRLTIAGSGPLLDDLNGRIDAAGMSDRFSVTGAPIAQEDLPAFFASGDVFCLPCVWAGDDDVDGLPQMLMESLACGVPVVSTRLVGIPDLVIDGRTGLLVAPGDEEALAGALSRIMDDPAAAASLAAKGLERVQDRFDAVKEVGRLVDLFRKALETAGES